MSREDKITSLALLLFFAVVFGPGFLWHLFIWSLVFLSYYVFFAAIF